MGKLTSVTARRAQTSFGRSFDSYHHGARAQRDIAQALAQQLQAAGAPNRFANALEIGCGTGHLTEALHQSCRFDRLTLNDLVPEAAQVAVRFKARFLPGDIRSLDWPKQPDLICSASTLQWIAEPEALLQRLWHHLAPGGWLALSSFGPDQYRELSALGSKAQAPGLRSAEALQQVLLMAGASSGDIRACGGKQMQIWFDTPVEVLRHLRATGVNARASQPWSRSRLQRFADRYLAGFGTDQGVPLSYNPVWLIARKNS